MKVLITGATGFIGKEVAHFLFKSGYQISGLTRSIEKAKTQIPFPCDFYEWRDLNQPPPQEAFKDVSVIINLAGEPLDRKRWSAKQKKNIYNSRVEFTKQLVSVAQNFPQIKTWIQASAIGFYGDRGSEILDETSPMGRGFLPHLCAEWEKEALKFKTNTNRVIVFRLGLILSQKGGMLKKLLPIFQYGLGGKLSHGKHWMSWISLDDLVPLFKKCIENPYWQGIFNITTLKPVTNTNFTKTLSKVLKKPALFPTPYFVLRIVLGEMGSIICQSQRVLPTQLQKQGTIYQHPNLFLALSHTLNKKK